MIHPDFEVMALSVPRLLQVNFASLRDSVPDYASHTSITPTRSWTSDWLLAILAANKQQNGVMSTRSFLPASQLSPLKYSARWSVFSPHNVHRTSIGKKTQPTSAPLSLSTTSLPSHSTAIWSQKRSRRRSTTATLSLWCGGFAHAHHGVGTSLRTSKSRPGRSPV